MDEIFWKAGYVILFLIWFFTRGFYRQKAIKHKAKEKVRPGFESLLVALNMAG
jgi:hypothetical protein